MTKTFKRITALAVAAVTAGAISAAAYAVGPVGTFTFNIYGHGQYEYSDPVTKVALDDYAAVHPEGGIISETSFMYLSVHNYSGTPGSAVTNTIMATKVDDYMLPYNAPVKTRKDYCLKGQIGYYDSYLGGFWAP